MGIVAAIVWRYCLGLPRTNVRVGLIDEAMITSFALLLLSADPAWQQVSSTDGYLLERRVVPGSAYYEYRVTTDTDVSVNALCDGVFEWGSVSKDHDQLRQRKLLED